MQSNQAPNRAESFQDKADASESENLDCYQSTLQGCGSCFGFLRTWVPFPFCCVDYPYKVIEQSYEGLMERFGRYTKTMKPLLSWPRNENFALAPSMSINIFGISNHGWLEGSCPYTGCKQVPSWPTS